MACHNTRNGETDDSTASTLSGAIGRGPHLGPQTDILFGVNAYFVPTSNPSPHLAIQDTCVGCHYAIPNAEEKAAGQTTNHSFIADLSICSTCHGSTSVNGAALQAAVKAQMSTLDKVIFGNIAATLAAETTYTVTSVLDTVTGDYLCTTTSGTPAFTFTGAQTPPAGTMTEPQPAQKWRSLATVWGVPQGITGAAECTSAGAVVTGVTYNGTAPVAIALGNVKVGPASVFLASSTVAKAISNEALIHDDESWGIHNLPFTQTVIASTMTALGAP
jgi:hypothetical protein